jgi:hypothetical protein
MLNVAGPGVQKGLFAAKGAEEILEAVDLYFIHRRKEHSYFPGREALSREPLEIADGKIA